MIRTAYCGGVRLGDALAALGRKVGLTDEDIANIDQTRDKSPAKP